tara:strand:+ start:659 stop:880 length:222 start_codon:yes stop_codon:yes gene_type:complete
MSTDKRNFDFDINTSNDLNKMLTGVLMQVRRGEINHETVKSITLVADKINKNNVNQLEYKKLCKHKKELSFFD